MLPCPYTHTQEYIYIYINMILPLRLIRKAVGAVLMIQGKFEGSHFRCGFKVGRRAQTRGKTTSEKLPIWGAIKPNNVALKLIRRATSIYQVVIKDVFISIGRTALMSFAP